MIYKLKKPILTFFLLLLNSNLVADIELWPGPYIVISKNQQYYFKMYPDSIDSYNENKGCGLAFKRTEHLEDSLLWKTSGWYATNVFLSNDGKYLIRFGNWPDRPRAESDLAIAFYNNGKLIKSYFTSDIIKDTTKIQYSVSHYNYSERYEFDPWKDEFVLVSIDDIIYTFDIKTGEIILQEKDNYFKKYINKYGIYHLIYFFITIPIILLFLFKFIHWFISEQSKNKLKKETLIFFKWYFSSFLAHYLLIIGIAIYYRSNIIQRSMEFFAIFYRDTDSLYLLLFIAIPYLIYTTIRFGKYLILDGISSTKKT